MMRRVGMGENPQDSISNEPPNRDDGSAFAIEDVSDLHVVHATGATDTLTGTTIGHYLIGERLGGGAMAAVYRAQDQLLGQTVAIKVVLPGADTVMQARFRREARMVSTLIHPHIVRTLQVGRSSGVVYIAMELIAGTTLAEVLEQNGKLTVADAARILAPIAEALAYAHGKGIVHRDVKPSNILLQRVEPGVAQSVTIAPLTYPVIPLLSDFGIARALDAPELTNAGRTIGTPAFMAPEQCAGSSEIDGRADVYALGAVLYRCLVGRAPFSGSTTQILHAHVYDPLLIPDEVADALPSQAMQVLARAMMKEPAQRYANIGMMADELAQVASLPRAISEPADAIVDSTMTMASLPAAKSPTTSTSRVLVPAAGLASARPVPPKPLLRPSVPLTTPVRAMTPSPKDSRPRSRRSRWGMIALVSALSVLVVLAAGMLINSAWPNNGDDDLVAQTATTTPAAVAVMGTPPASTREATPPSVGTSDASGAGQTAQPTASPTPSGPTPTPGPPILALLPTWELAVASYDEANWQDAVDFLGLVKRTIEEFDLPGEEEIDPQEVVARLVTSYIGLATDAVKSGSVQGAVDNMTKAAELAPNVALLADMVTNLEGLAELAELDDPNEADVQRTRTQLLSEFAELQAAFASRLVREDKVCDALLHVGYARRIADSVALQAQYDELEATCRDRNAEIEIVKTGGTILYSSVDGDRNNIYRLPVTQGVGVSLPSSLVVANGSQPQLSPYGNLLAYYSDGLVGMRVSGLSPDGEVERFSPNPEDSRNSPPSWNSGNSNLVYSTAFASPAEHIWVTTANTDMDVRDLGIGKDPAWRPNSDVIVFNGPDNNGQNVGLYWMTTANGGADRKALTVPLNGNDQRPVWTSDGKYVVFMSKDRSGGPSWEIYRMEWTTGIIIQLTDGHFAQDGLPAISPDNRWVAFMSDRGDRWNLYYVSIDGGEVYFLSSISGQPISWLEHSIQWVP